MSDESRSSPAAWSALAAAWLRALAVTGFTPLSTAELERLVDGQVAALATALATADPQVIGRIARAAGAAVVGARFVDAEGLRASLHVLGSGLSALAEADGRPDPAGRVHALLGEFGAGYAAAFRDWLFGQQEDVKLAFKRATGEVERRLRRSEVRFREVFVRSAIGIAISDAGGKLTQVNPALAEILGVPPHELVGRTLDEFCHPQDGVDLRTEYHELSGLGGRPLRRRRRLVRPDGQLVWVYLAVSVLHDVDEMPTLHLTMVENVSDLHLLQDLTSHQSLHDVGTGLPNRQYLLIQLQHQLGGLMDDELPVTLFHLDLDGFTAINHGVGLELADMLLVVVGRRLEAMFAGRRVLVARLAGDEFAVLFCTGRAPADVLETVSRINEHLAEPVHLPAGGIGLSASIGVAHGQAGETSPAELLRRADAALRRAQATGHRQWAEYDGPRDITHRRRATLAATLSGALEFGELAVRWQPWISLVRPDRLAGLSIRAGWDHPEHGHIDHDECLALAEMTGAAVPFAAWLIEVAAEQARRWGERFGPRVPPIGIALTVSQIADPDLVGTVRAAVTRAGVGADTLCLGVPTRALAGHDVPTRRSVAYDGEARDNIGLLTGMGVRVVLRDAGIAPIELLLSDEWPICAVQMAESLVAELAEASPDSRLARTAGALVRTLCDVELPVVVSGLRGVREVDWWRAAGARAACGPRFGAPDTTERMTLRLATSGV